MSDPAHPGNVQKSDDQSKASTARTQSTDPNTQRAHVLDGIRGILRRHGIFPDQLDACANEIDTIIWQAVVPPAGMPDTGVTSDPDRQPGEPAPKAGSAVETEEEQQARARREEKDRLDR